MLAMRCKFSFDHFRDDQRLSGYSGLHGYTHEFVAELNEKQERDVLKKSIEVLTTFTGKKPKGWTAPAWATSKNSIKLLEEFGIEYDHSMMHHDSQMYYVPDNTQSFKESNYSVEASEWMTPMSQLKPSSIVEVPANWHLDDWPPMQPQRATASSGFIDPHTVERLWKEQFDFFYREYDTFVFPISIHPQVSGKPQVVLMHERMIEYINSHEGVEWCTFEQMVKLFKDGEFAGVEVEGGAEV